MLEFFLANIVVISGIVFAVFITVLLSWVIYNGLKGVSLKEMFLSPSTGEVSHTKLWTNIAYLVATIAFIKFNFTENPKDLLDMWLVYLTIIAGNGTLSKFISMKYGERQVNDSPPQDGDTKEN